MAEAAEWAVSEAAGAAEAGKDIVVPDVDNTENGDTNVQVALAAQIAKLDAKKTEDKSGERELNRLYKKASKDLKEQLEGLTDGEKVKVLQQKFLDKVHQFNSSERKIDGLQVYF